jgi:hypothetical protein
MIYCIAKEMGCLNFKGDQEMSQVKQIINLTIITLWIMTLMLRMRTHKYLDANFISLTAIEEVLFYLKVCFRILVRVLIAVI